MYLADARYGVSCLSLPCAGRAVRYVRVRGNCEGPALQKRRVSEHHPWLLPAGTAALPSAITINTAQLILDTIRNTRLNKHQQNPREAETRKKTPHSTLTTHDDEPSLVCRGRAARGQLSYRLLPCLPPAARRREVDTARLGHRRPLQPRGMHPSLLPSLQPGGAGTNAPFKAMFFFFNETHRAGIKPICFYLISYGIGALY